MSDIDKDKNRDNQREGRRQESGDTIADFSATQLPEGLHIKTTMDLLALLEENLCARWEVDETIDWRGRIAELKSGLRQRKRSK